PRKAAIRSNTRIRIRVFIRYSSPRWKSTGSKRRWIASSRRRRTRRADRARRRALFGLVDVQPLHLVLNIFDGLRRDSVKLADQRFDIGLARDYRVRIDLGESRLIGGILQRVVEG